MWSKPMRQAWQCDRSFVRLLIVLSTSRETQNAAMGVTRRRVGSAMLAETPLAVRTLRLLPAL